MEFIYYDHRAITKPFQHLSDLAKILGLTPKTPAEVTALRGPWVAFVHQGLKETNDVNAWLKLISNNSNWIVFVSSDLNTLPNPDDYPEKKIKRINVELPSILKRLTAKPKLITYFKASCESASGPNMHFLEGGASWPQKALAKYLLLKTGTVVTNKELSSAHLTDQDVIDEFLAREIELPDFNCDSLKSAILESVVNVD